MVNDILAGILIGISITLISVVMVTFVAKRKCWVDIKIAPSPNAPSSELDRMLLESLADKSEELQAGLKDTTYKLERLCSELDPYLSKKRGD